MKIVTLFNINKIVLQFYLYNAVDNHFILRHRFIM